MANFVVKDSFLRLQKVVFVVAGLYFNSKLIVKEINEKK